MKRVPLDEASLKRLRAILRAMAAEDGLSLRKWCDKHQLAHGYVWGFLSGKRPPGPQILQALGLRLVWTLDVHMEAAHSAPPQPDLNGPGTDGTPPIDGPQPSPAPDRDDTQLAADVTAPADAHGTATRKAQRGGRAGERAKPPRRRGVRRVVSPP